MLGKGPIHFIAIGGAIISTLSLSSVASAYNNETHFKIADLAWQVMRSAADRKLRQHVPWTTAAPNDATFDYLDEVGNCSGPPLDCANSPVSQQQWSDYIQKLGPTLRRLNRLHNEVPTPETCQQIQQTPAGSFVQDFFWPITGGYRDRIDTGSGDVAREHPATCDFAGPAWDGIYTNQSEPAFGNANVVLPDDGNRLQGLVFGYHAQQRDNEWADTIMMTEPVIGHVLDSADEASRFPLKVLLAALICGYEWITDGNTDRCNEDVDHILDKIDPTNFLRSIIGGPDLAPSGDYVGLWHHINVRTGVVHDYYDDKPGVYYQEAGPEAEPGVIDVAVGVASHVLQLVIDASPQGSYGPARYQIYTSEDGQQATNRRESNFAPDAWQAQLLSDTIFEPLDNFAQYGWAQYQADAAKGKFGGAALSWPLHAIGDATVPQHVTATTSWGHRPYEEWVQHKWDTIMFERCNISGRGMPFACNDDFFKLQISQARRILQWGLFWTRVTANTTGVRSFIESVAEKTLLTVTDSKTAWPFCDACSFKYQMMHSDFLSQTGIAIAELERGLGEAVNLDPEAHYDPSATNIQNLVEMAAGATIAFLMKASEGVCDDLGASCTQGDKCCSQKCDSAGAGTCCRDRGQHCWDDTECCAGTQCGSKGVCCNTSQTGACSTDAECCQGKCNNGFCCSAQPGDACSTSTDCCGGSCVNGVCCQTSLGAACTSDAACCAGSSGNKCSSQNQCCNVAAAQSCGSGDVCCRGSCTNGKCCVNGGSTCTVDAECCNGASCLQGKCCGDVGSSCGNATDCCSRVCKNNTCVQCTPVGSACATSSDCCLGTCQGGICQTCLQDGPTSPCMDPSQCCSNQCSQGFCTTLR